MNAQEIGKKLVDYCKQNKNLDSINTLYSPDIVSVEAHAPPGQDRTVKGIEGVRKRASGGEKITRSTAVKSTGPTRTVTIASPCASFTTSRSSLPGSAT
jgi:hypothetical protein